MTVLTFSALGVHSSGCSFRVRSGTYEKICENSLAYSVFGVRCSMFDVFWNLISQQFSIFHRGFLHFPGGNTIVPTFRLDGGTIPLRKQTGRFQKPYILRDGRRANRTKKRTVPFDGPKAGFYTVFTATAEVAAPLARSSALPNPNMLDFNSQSC